MEGFAGFVGLMFGLVVLSVIITLVVCAVKRHRREWLQDGQRRVWFCFVKLLELPERFFRSGSRFFCSVRFRTFRMVRTFGRSDSISFCRDAGFRVQLRFCVGSAGKPAAGPSGFFAREGNIVFRGVAWLRRLRWQYPASQSLQRICNHGSRGVWAWYRRRKRCSV